MSGERLTLPLIGFCFCRSLFVENLLTNFVFYLRRMGALRTASRVQLPLWALPFLLLSCSYPRPLPPPLLRDLIFLRLLFWPGSFCAPPSPAILVLNIRLQWGGLSVLRLVGSISSCEIFHFLFFFFFTCTWWVRCFESGRLISFQKSSKDRLIKLHFSVFLSCGSYITFYKRYSTSTTLDFKYLPQTCMSRTHTSNTHPVVSLAVSRLFQLWLSFFLFFFYFTADIFLSMRLLAVG